MFSLFAGFRLRAVIDGHGGFVPSPQQELDAAASLYETAGRFQVMVYLPAAIVFVVWFFLMRRNTGLLTPDRFRNGPGWAIGAWLVGAVRLQRPVQSVRRADVPGRRRGAHCRRRCRHPFRRPADRHAAAQSD
ncbi:DUF4328 domain-containing protein [Streptomyces sp. NBC_00443]|uniref:DUF4328 domain-containing protein n=1 Tax=Streptomyces sp. NBC_00443 TaxID=2975743 RepID=UPI002E1F661E